MLEKQQEEVRIWQKLFGLTHWCVTLRVHSPDKDEELEENEAYAEIQSRRYMARITLSSKYKKEWSHDILHEVVHILVKEHFSYVELLIEEPEVAEIYDLLEEQLVHSITEAIYHLATTIKSLDKGDGDDGTSKKNISTPYHS